MAGGGLERGVGREVTFCFPTFWRECCGDLKVEKNQTMGRERLKTKKGRDA